MWYPVPIAEPADDAEPLTVDLVKTAAKVETYDDDTLVKHLRAVARAHVENHCGLRFAVRSSASLVCDSFSDFARPSEAPVTAVSSITYIDTAGVSQTLPTSVYELRADGIEPSIVLKYGQAWPAIRSGSRITVTATIGFATVPPPVLHAMVLLFAHHYERRQAAIETNVDEIPFGVECLLVNYRRNP